MPEKKHMNFKLDETATELWERIAKRVTAELGFEPSQSQIVGHALKCLEKRYAEEDRRKK